MSGANERGSLGRAEDALKIAAFDMTEQAGPAELEAMMKLSQYHGCESLPEALMGMVIGFYVARGATPEEIGDAVTGMAREIIKNL
jgi:hypothetical protein